jgi:hypothetical protein
MSLSLFRFIASVGRTLVVANTFGSFALLLIFVLGGFVISKGLFSISRETFNFQHRISVNNSNIGMVWVLQMLSVHGGFGDTGLLR